jgi:class 3 adenylate cyclase
VLARRETDPLVLAAIVAALVREAGPQEAEWALEHPDAAVRFAALAALGALDTPEADRILARAAARGDRAARDILAQRTEERIRDALPPGPEGWALAEVLGVDPTESVLEFLESFEGNDGARLEALRTLARSGRLDAERLRRLRDWANLAEGEPGALAKDIVRRHESAGGEAEPAGTEPPRGQVLREIALFALTHHDRCGWDDPVLTGLCERLRAAESALREASSEASRAAEPPKEGDGFLAKARRAIAGAGRAVRTRIEVRRAAADRDRLMHDLAEEVCARAEHIARLGEEWRRILDQERRSREFEARRAEESRRRLERRKEAVWRALQRGGHAAATVAGAARDFMILQAMKVDAWRLRAEFDRRLRELAAHARAIGTDTIEGIPLVGDDRTVGGMLYAESRRRDLAHDVLRRRCKALRLLELRLAEKEVQIRKAAEDVARDDLAALLQRRRALEEDVNRIDRRIMEAHGRYLAVVFTDMKDFTARSERMGLVELMALLEEHDGLIVSAVERHGGRVVKKIGDAIMASFQDPLPAVLAAIDMQVTLRERNAGRPELERIEVRVGIHSGRVLIKEGDLYGDTVNVASRVQGLALPGQILVTHSIVESVGSRVEAQSLGQRSVKGKQEPVVVYSVSY